MDEQTFFIQNVIIWTPAIVFGLVFSLCFFKKKPTQKPIVNPAMMHQAKVSGLFLAVIMCFELLVLFGINANDGGIAYLFITPMILFIVGLPLVLGLFCYNYLQTSNNQQIFRNRFLWLSSPLIITLGIILLYKF